MKDEVQVVDQGTVRHGRSRRVGPSERRPQLFTRRRRDVNADAPRLIGRRERLVHLVEHREVRHRGGFVNVERGRERDGLGEVDPAPALPRARRRFNRLSVSDLRAVHRSVALLKASHCLCAVDHHRAHERRGWFETVVAVGGTRRVKSVGEVLPEQRHGAGGDGRRHRRAAHFFRPARLPAGDVCVRQRFRADDVIPGRYNLGFHTTVQSGSARGE